MTSSCASRTRQVLHSHCPLPLLPPMLYILNFVSAHKKKRKNIGACSTLYIPTTPLVELSVKGYLVCQYADLKRKEGGAVSGVPAPLPSPFSPRGKSIYSFILFHSPATSLWVPGFRRTMFELARC